MTLNHAERQNDSWTPYKKRKKKKTTLNPTKRFDAIYSYILQTPLKIFFLAKRSFCRILTILSSCLNLVLICAGRQPSVFVVSDRFSGLKGQESQIGSRSKMNREKIMCTILTMNAINCGDNLPQGTMASPSLEVFKSWLERLSKWCCVAQN